MRTFFVGTVIGQSANLNGYMVQVYIGGIPVTYGPMHFIAGGDGATVSNERSGGNARTVPPATSADDPRIPSHPDPYKSGDKVLIANYLLRDQFVILGKYVDMNPPVHELVQVDSDGDGIIDLIEESYEEAP